jgi:DNA-binding response OmpR family regulator
MMSARTIVVVEDEETIAAAVAARLRAEGFRVETAGDGPGGVELCRRVRPDLVILDLMLPGFDGIEVCRRIQADRPVAVLMLTARDAETDVLVGLGVGADDYMTKPFSPRELAARVHALFRRLDRFAAAAADGALPRIVLGQLEIDQATRRVRRAGAPAHLTPTEFELLVHLASRPGTVFNRDALLAHVWGWADATGTRTVDSHVKALRRKLGADLIRTVHGVGYALETERSPTPSAPPPAIPRRPHVDAGSVPPPDSQQGVHP